MVYQLTSKNTGETFAYYDSDTAALARAIELFTLFGRERVEDLILESRDKHGTLTLLAEGRDLVVMAGGTYHTNYQELFPKRNGYTIGHIEEI